MIMFFFSKAVAKLHVKCHLMSKLNLLSVHPVVSFLLSSLDYFGIKNKTDTAI